MSIIDKHSPANTTIDHHRYLHSTTNPMKRKLSTKLEIVKSTEFEPRETILNRIDSNFTRENDFDDYTDQIFDYLDETSNKKPLVQVESHQMTSSSSPQSIVPVHTSDNEIKSFSCAFCPYIANTIQEFQTHIAKHTEKNFRCLLCNCMYKYRRDCVTHMKRKHSNTVTGSISQYIQKMNSTNNNCLHQSSSTPSINPNSSIEPKRYGCPYCSLMTKSTSSIYKHQSRKHASFPKIVHKYSTDDPNTRNLVAILKQKSIKKPTLPINKTEPLESPTESLQTNDPFNVSSPLSSSPSLLHQQTDSYSLINRHRCAASKHIIAQNIHSSNGRLSKVFQCCLCDYRACHRSNVVRHVKKIHTIDLDECNLSPTLINNDIHSQNSDKLIIDEEYLNDSHAENIPNYSLNTIVQAPLVVSNSNNQSYADIHLSINIFLPKKRQQLLNNSDIYSAEESSEDEDDTTKIHISSSSQQPNGSLYKPHKCRRCFYRSNWKTDMLHHIRLKHHINHATKSDYLSMDFDSALRSFPDYEKTFGKVLKNRLLLPKIDYIDCTWEELKSKLFPIDEQKKRTSSSSSSSIEHHTCSLSMNNDEKNLLIGQ